MLLIACFFQTWRICLHTYSLNTAKHAHGSSEAEDETRGRRCKCKHAWPLTTAFVAVQSAEASDSRPSSHRLHLLSAMRPAHHLHLHRSSPPPPMASAWRRSSFTQHLSHKEVRQWRCRCSPFACCSPPLFAIHAHAAIETTALSSRHPSRAATWQRVSLVVSGDRVLVRGHRVRRGHRGASAIEVSAI